VTVLKDATVTTFQWANPHTIVSGPHRHSQPVSAGLARDSDGVDAQIEERLATNPFKWIPDQRFDEQLCIPSQVLDYLKFVAGAVH